MLTHPTTARPASCVARMHGHGADAAAALASQAAFMALARTLELLKIGERVNDELYRSTTRRDPSHESKRRLERAPDVWSRFVLRSAAIHRPAGT